MKIILVADIAFVHPEFFLLLLLLPAAAYWYWRKAYDPVFTHSDLSGWADFRTWRTAARPLLPLLKAAAFVAFVIALARPQELLEEQKVKAEGIDIFLVMDLSSSMLARDFKPDRLEASKRVAAEFVDKRPYDRIGLVVFAGEAYTQTPMTIDHRVLKEALAQLQCGLIEDGTAIGMGLATAVNHIKDSKAKSKVIILLTDGVNNAGYIKPLTAAEIAREFGVKVYTIGVGKTGEAYTPISRRSDGRYIFGMARVEIDEALLQKIAQMTGGRYFRATNEEMLQRIYDEIDRLEKTELEVLSTSRKTEKFHGFVLAGFLLLLLELLLRLTALQSLP